MTNTLKLHKIRNVDLAVCSAEQKVAYNLTFAHYNTNPARKFTPGEFADWCMKLYHPDNKTAEKYSREAIKKAIENGYMNYLNKPFITSDYEQIGNAFPVEPVPEYEATPEGNQTAEQPEEQAKPGNGKPKTCKRPNVEKSHCIMSASSLKALETMINSYYFSKNYIITEDMTVYNTVTEKTLDSVYVKVTPAGRYQCRKIDVFGESKEPEKAEQKHDSEFSGSLLDGQLENHLEESTTTNKEESPMKENTNAAVQATETTPETVPAVVIEPEEETAHGAKWTEYLENDCQFYPTPAEIAEKLASLINWENVKTVLEPSAGKGDLMQAVKAHRVVTTWTDRNGEKREYSETAFKGTFDCVEIAPELCAILQSKGYSPENADFLEWDCMKYYDAVVMNPPFRQAEKHILKALELLKCGGQLAAIINAETLKNQCTVYRKDLAAKLAEYGAKIEYLDGAFSEAERKTNVSIAIIYVNIPEKQCTYDYFARMDTAHTYNTGSAESAENSENTTLATSDIIENLLNSYKNEAQASMYILRKWRSISALVPELLLTYSEYGLKNTAIDSDRLSTQIRLKYWKKLFLSKTVQDKLTESTRDNFQKKIDTFGKYEFNIKNIYTLLGDLTENLASDIESDMLKLWDRLTYHSSMYKNTNIHYYNGWETNDAYKIGSKIVWNCYCSEAYTYKKYVQYYHTFIQDIDELDKIFQYLNGGKRPTADSRSTLDIFRDSVSGECYQGEKISFPFFDAIFYKKGTAHIIFRFPDLVKKWNIFAGRKHNFLPNDYGKECYNNLKKSQKEVADSFEGKEGYQDTHKNYEFYSGGAAVAMLGMNDSTTAQPETVAETATAEEEATEAAETVLEVCRFAVGAKYAYKKSYVTITERNESMVEISVDGKTIAKNAEISDNVEIIKNSRGVTLCRADKLYTGNTPTDPTGSPTDGTDSPTESPEQSASETIHPTAENPTEAPTEPETGKAEETELLELPETKSIKFYYNGMKINGDKKITVKCSYDMDKDGQTVRIYADGYGAQIPRDVFDNVKNDSDIMTDYFDNDSCTVTPEHPLFKYIQYAAAKYELRGYKANKKEIYEKFIAVNPGQPTSADLSAVAKYNADRAAAAKAAAEEKERAEQAEHERQLSELCEFSGSMVQMVCEKYPIRDGAPTVRIEWSEHPAFSDGFTMSISAAQILFSIFDEKQAYDRQKENHSGAWYYKTKFVIDYTDPETGETGSYIGRQDLGDGEGGILEHMLNHAEWERTHSGDIATYGKIIENPPETTDKLDFIKWLSQFLESSPDSDGTECQEITMQTSTGSTADTPDSAQAQKQAIAVTFAPELKQAAEKHSENYAECEQIMKDIDTAVSVLPPEDIAHILDTLPRDTLGVLMTRRICHQYAKTDPANAAMLLGAWILDFTNNDGVAQ